MEAPLAQGTIGQFGQNHVATVSHGNDRGLMAEFFIMDEYKPFLSAKEGIAIYEPVEMIRISVPGAKTDIIQRVKHKDDIDGPAHTNRFPAQYKAFKDGLEQVPDGTALEMCKFMPSHRVKMLKAQGIHTAEQYADCADNVVQTLGMGAARERDLCRTYVGSDDEKTRQVSRLQAEAENAKGELEALKLQMADLNRIMAEQMVARGQIYATTLAQNFPEQQTGPLPGEVFEEAPGPTPKRGPGRPRKDEQ